MKIYEDLFSQVIQEINKRVGKEYITTDIRYAVQPSGEGGNIDARALSEIISTIVQDLGELIEARIISGLDVTASTPASATINITAGTATSHGKKWTLEDNISLIIPLDSSTYIFYVTIYNDALEITRTYDDTRCQICKIIVPKPGTSSKIVDDKPSDGYDAYIVSAKDIVFKETQEFDDASVEKLRDVIGKVLADNIIGNLRLSENMKILNTSGTLELNSQEVKFLDVSGSLLANFKPTGLYFYDKNGGEVTKFTNTTARIGNIVINPNALQSANFLSGTSGFQIKDTGNVEFNNAIFRGTIYATAGTIGGWSLNSNSLYATTTGIIKTSLNVGSGYDGVVLDKDGLRVYNAVLGMVVNLPSDGSAPTFSSGIINQTIFEINTNAVLRTSETVGDGSALSYGILINNTGIYGCSANQLLSDANFKVLIDGNAYFKGEIRAASGQIANISITSSGLYGGLLEGSIIRAPIIESSATYPKIRLDESGFYYMVTTATGIYGPTYQYGDGVLYGSGVLAYLFNENYPILAVVSEQNLADIRFYNRSADPITGTHAIGDVICVSGALKLCSIAGSPGTFSNLKTTFLALTDAPSSYTDQALKLVRVNSGETALEFIAENKYLYLAVPEEVLFVATDKAGRFYIDFAATIKEVHAAVSTAPTGASIICDINLNGTSVWSATPANRVTITATNYTGTQTSFDTSSVVAGDYFTLDVDQVGSTDAGEKLVIRIKLEKS